MLGLRSKLALGFGGLLAVLLVLGLQAIRWLDRLGGSIDVILRENYRSVIACEDMKEALERMDSGALFALAGHAEEGSALAATHGPRFERALAVELGNITLPGEGEAAERLREAYGRYEPALRRVLDTSQRLDSRRETYFGELLPIFQEIKATADEILRMNQENMVAANAEARDLAALARRRMILLLALGSVLAAGCVFLLGRAILVPLHRLTASARRIEAGDLDVVVEARSRDELGRLALAFNEMTGHLRELRRSDRAQLLSAHQALQRGVTAVRELIEPPAEELRSAFEGAGVGLTVDVDPDTPPVAAQPERIRFALRNLLNNAFAATPPGGAVSVVAKRRLGAAEISVSDTGRAIPAQYLERIFERYFQVPGTEAFGSAGLGLSLARETIEAHGGTIDCESREGRGSTFRVTLPAAGQDAQSPEPGAGPARRT